MRTWLSVLLFLASSLAHPAEGYPSKPIRVILQLAPGGGADITARTVVPKLTEVWGQQIIVDNRPGGGGTFAMTIGARATPDGYTIVQSSMATLAVAVSLHSKLPYDPVRDFTPIARAVSALNILVVHPSLPVHSVKDLINYAKANPGKLNFGSSGVGHADHLAREISKTLGLNM